ncbi:hypothetical protein [Pleurocapsa sp. PCC 7319]|uniref:hypothetical protein n=1 Tax=Pleurocapsa sp. PCC 7319 TaxID=118161 RepID=UPI000688FC26
MIAYVLPYEGGYKNCKHVRLKALAKSRGISLNKLMEEFSTIALTEFDAENRFRALAAQGDPEEGLKILDKLDRLHHSE